MKQSLPPNESTDFFCFPALASPTNLFMIFFPAMHGRKRHASTWATTTTTVFFFSLSAMTITHSEGGGGGRGDLFCVGRKSKGVIVRSFQFFSSFLGKRRKRVQRKTAKVSRFSLSPLVLYCPLGTLRWGKGLGMAHEVHLKEPSRHLPRLAKILKAAVTYCHLKLLYREIFK